MSEFSIKDGLEGLSSNELIDLIMNLTQRDRQVRLHVLEWLEENCATNKKVSNSNKKSKAPEIHDELLLQYWHNSQSIISEFNCYGGGPEEEEEEAYEWLEKISGLIRENKITPEAKHRFMDEAFIEYDAGNSGFDDSLMDLFFELCKEKDEWEFLVQKLNRGKSDWGKKLVMEIYRDHLKDDFRYLEERLKNLQYGMDYWDLVQYYTDKGNEELALEIGHKGIKHGKGRLTELYDYLIDHYSQLRDKDRLESIAETAMQRENDESYVLERLFTFYKDDDYEKAKEKLILVYKTTNHKKYFEEYKRMKNYLSELDWEKIEPEIVNEAQKNNMHDYLSICLQKGMKDIVLKTIISPPVNQWGYAGFSDFDIFAQKLEKEHPKEILEYYSNKAYARIPNGNRNTYKEAVEYLGKVKAIYLKHLKDEDSWTHMLSKLLMEFKKRPAFIDEIRKSKL